MAESVYIDPSRAREFAGDLGSATCLYRQAVERLSGNLGRLSATWRDAQFEEFEREVKELRRGLVEYVAEADKAIAHLSNLAEHADEYHREQQG